MRPSQTAAAMVHSPLGFVFFLRLYLRQQPLRTEWLAEHLRPMCDLLEYWITATGGNEHPERTLKEEVPAEWETISRRAKRRWADDNGHDCISLQHIGDKHGIRGSSSPCGLASGLRM